MNKIHITVKPINSYFPFRKLMKVDHDSQADLAPYFAVKQPQQSDNDEDVENEIVIKQWIVLWYTFEFRGILSFE